MSADRRLTHTGCHSGIAAVADGLDRVFNVQSGDAGTSATDLEFTPLLGCELISRRVFPESNVAVFEVGLGRTLTKGETHAYAYEIVDRGPLEGRTDSDGFVWGPPHTARPHRLRGLRGAARDRDAHRARARRGLRRAR